MQSRPRLKHMCTRFSKKNVCASAQLHTCTPAHADTHSPQRILACSERRECVQVCAGVCECVQVCASGCKCVRVGAGVRGRVGVRARNTNTHTHEHTHYNNGNWIEGGSTNERKQGLERGGLKYWGGFGYRISKVGPHENQLPETPQLFSKFQCYGHPT